MRLAALLPPIWPAAPVTCVAAGRQSAPRSQGTFRPAPSGTSALPTKPGRPGMPSVGRSGQD